MAKMKGRPIKVLKKRFVRVPIKYDDKTGYPIKWRDEIINITSRKQITDEEMSHLGFTSLLEILFDENIQEIGALHRLYHSIKDLRHREGRIFKTGEIFEIVKDSWNTKGPSPSQLHRFINKCVRAHFLRYEGYGRYRLEWGYIGIFKDKRDGTYPIKITIDIDFPPWIKEKRVRKKP